jgi:hypothetical protein
MILIAKAVIYLVSAFLLTSVACLINADRKFLHTFESVLLWGIMSGICLRVGRIVWVICGVEKWEDSVEGLEEESTSREKG